MISDISSAIAPTGSPQNTVSPLLSLDLNAVGKLYIIDFFKSAGSQDCTHGDMVFDVAKQTLTNYGVGHLANTHIQKIEVDFFENKEAASKIIREYISSLPSTELQQNLTDALNFLRAPSWRFFIPDKGSQSMQILMSVDNQPWTVLGNMLDVQ